MLKYGTGCPYDTEEVVVGVYIVKSFEDINATESTNEEQTVLVSYNFCDVKKKPLVYFMGKAHRIGNIAKV
ncbi:MAG: hypothetical protein J7J75_04600 [Euryarchaeota archaeon]|nr:hypothetical protein [Euryarchaeota archaeon]MCD6158900.1 hypothetical protein [Euryarchaeota archaeon]